MHRLLAGLSLAVLAGCQAESAVTPPLTLGAQHAGATSPPRYEVEILPLVGATDNRGIVINSRGWVAGRADLADGSRRAVLWRDGEAIELGTLGGPSSTVAWLGLNTPGMVVGMAHTAEVDTLNERWSCEAGAFLTPTNPRLACRGFWWENGVMHELPTLGGTHGVATTVNNRGQVVGWAETAVVDPTCTGDQVLQFRAVLWEPRQGITRELRPYPGDSASAATGINQRGQVVGISGDCDQAVGRYSARRAVMWDGDQVIEIPNLGGTTWHTPMDINERGDVVGFSNLPEPGDPAAFTAHAFFWRNGSATARDLGVLDDDSFSQAMAINSRGQIVGVSFGGAQGLRAFLWQDDGMLNLNDLVDLAPTEVLEVAQSVNEAGQISGRLLNTATGERRGFVATPKGHLR